MSDVTDVLSKAEVLALECPLCAAKPGRPCHPIGSDREVDPHYLRRDAAWFARQKQETEEAA